MERVSLDDQVADPLRSSSEHVPLAPALGTAAVGVTRYRIEPGEGFPSGLHAHPDQMEVFVVLTGTATVETYPPLQSPAAEECGGEDPGAGGPEASEETRHDADAASLRGTRIQVDAGEAVRFAQGEFQSGWNEGTAALIVLAIGAPRAEDDVRLPVRCPTCDERGLALQPDGAAPALACVSCARDHEPAPCPDCGGEDLRARLDDGGRPVVRCQDCGAAFDRPPVAD